MLKFASSTLLYIALSTGLIAATPAIGVAISDGTIRLDDSTTAGNATVFDGTVLRTQKATRVQMKGGARLQFANASQARLFSDHVDLQQGSAEISGLSANANGLRIDPQANSSASVELKGRAVQIAALTGNVVVYNARGISVANLLPGRALSLTPQDAGASAPSSLTGCVREKDSIFTLTDETSNVTVQLRGQNLKAGKRVKVTGTTIADATPAGGATQVLSVTEVKSAGGSCRAGAAVIPAGAGVGAAAGAAAGAAVGIGTTAAIVGGVAAAAVAGTAAGIAATSSGNSTSAAADVPVTCAGISPCK